MLLYFYQLVSYGLWALPLLLNQQQQKQKHNEKHTTKPQQLRLFNNWIYFRFFISSIYINPLITTQ
jgi:hypothetical protein